jgi:hypothetical protein
MLKLKKLFNNRTRQHMAAHNAGVESGEIVGRSISSIGVRAKVTRADGTVEPERLVSYGHRNPVNHLACAPFAYLNGWFWNWYYTHKRKDS